MILDAYWLVLIGCIIFIPRYLYFKLNPKNQNDLETKRLEMIGIIKWTGIVSLGGFIVLSAIAILYVVFGNSFYETFKYYDDVDNEHKSNFFTYRSMFFVGITSLTIFSILGGKLHHILSGKWIDEDLRQNDDLLE
jgi:hypothetical protein